MRWSGFSEAGLLAHCLTRRAGPPGAASWAADEPCHGGSCGCAVDSGGMAAGCDTEQRGAADRSLPAQSSQHPAGVAPSP